MTIKGKKKQEAKGRTVHYLSNGDEELDKFIVDNFNNEIYQDLINRPYAK